jgi:hypothetical protein
MIFTEDDDAMGSLTSSRLESRNETRKVAAVNSAHAWRAFMPVQMNVEDPFLSSTTMIDILHCTRHRFRSNPSTDRGVIHIMSIGDRMVAIQQDDLI